ncbi:conserved hypothetical protein [Talaromyces stipitatus ATCC 10500]|uniref:HTH CENPB-type domain-containing protein n=1 Tax=Talaromyces stipitatus (strain ATCC 10500 / CBS 375.48 / QM 6759 / NRRL 1006) TaxID=441959 RepID=B8MCK9_TALSN|nr:uncharacterized protein TSTA_125390 [Talaromyces stipitatus ATCC 10500]EED18825.1 conserved hypothetical protein [Talaromyces stipitatus ATCC 10500]
MPPIRKKDPLKSAQNEGKIELAISDLKNGRIRSIREAARIYTIPRTTLQDRLHGVPFQHAIRASNHKLTQFEEESLVKWVLDLTRRGLPPRHFLVRDMANYFLSQRGDQRVGDKWVYNLVQRRPEIESKFSQKYNYERAKCEDSKIIQGHFDRVRDIISEYGILPEDIYNFDETGFAMGLCATAKISIEHGITREEAQVLVQGQVEASQAVTTTPAEPELPTSQAVVRRQFRCSGCNVEGHRINRCPNRTTN